MTFEIAKLDQRIAEFDRTVSQILQDRQPDAKVIAFMELLLAQSRVCAAHYKLMAMEIDGRMLLSEAEFGKIIGEHLELSRLFCRIPKTSDDSVYEMASIYPLYTFVDSHFVEKSSGSIP